MEENKVTTRNKLKTYFETGKHPTQGQFSDLIDSLKHKEDVLTNREMAILANSLARIDNAFIYYNTNGVGNLKFPIVISSQGEDDQVITIKETDNVVVKQFLLGSAPYTIKTKEFSGGELKETEYYNLGYQFHQTYTINRLFGNNLNTIPDGFELGILDGKRIPIQIYKQNFGKKVMVVNTIVKFINNTEIPIQYRIATGIWNDRFRNEDTVTDHYDVVDYLSFYYSADLQASNKSINCEVYNADNNNLLATALLHAGSSSDFWGGEQLMEGLRNIRIECNYSKNEK
ncbi:hypothetical protein [Chryseobacterium sp. MEBOG07]|uniref:hypothetical protein n=1 Tax=Chryseobacterium sp. MEBOG07 TaxID=2879939 RepID=UPI001F3954DC|nr:hypothetical protein [Chryseobacterium sp. MEBOG07]UKB81185.1 hypothetical protein LF886_09415 [Chryseobacterium sp. MEBOG07]